MLLCACSYTAALSPGGGCNALSSTADGLLTGVGKTNLIPNIQATPGGIAAECQISVLFSNTFLLFQC